MKIANAISVALYAGAMFSWIYGWWLNGWPEWIGWAFALAAFAVFGAFGDRRFAHEWPARQEPRDWTPAGDAS